MQEEEKKLRMDFVTTAMIAKKLGVHKTTINRIANEHKLGVIVGQQRFFLKSEIKKIQGFCHFQKGNPNFSKKD